MRSHRDKGGPDGCAVEPSPALTLNGRCLEPDQPACGGGGLGSRRRHQPARGAAAEPVLLALLRIIAEEDILGRFLMTAGEAAAAGLLLVAVAIPTGVLLHRVRLLCE